MHLFDRSDLQTEARRCFCPGLWHQELSRQLPDGCAAIEKRKIRTHRESGWRRLRERGGGSKQHLPVQSNVAAALPTRACWAAPPARMLAWIRSAISGATERAMLSTVRQEGNLTA